MARYVPKTYNNRRVLRIVLSTIIIIIFVSLVLFLVLFFALQQYVVEGQLMFPAGQDAPPLPTPIPPE